MQPKISAVLGLRDRIRHAWSKGRVILCEDILATSLNPMEKQMLPMSKRKPELGLKLVVDLFRNN